MIGSAYNLAMEQKLVTRNPTQGCALPKVEHKEMKTLTPTGAGSGNRQTARERMFPIVCAALSCASVVTWA